MNKIIGFLKGKGQAEGATMNQQLSLFDYQALDAETRIVVQQRTGEIKALMKRTVSDIIEIGEKLIEVKERLGHGHFGGWLEAEFEWSERTARRYISVAETFKSDTVSDLRFDAKALYLLAAPSTPDEARAEAIERAEAGETITHARVKEIVAEHWIKPAPAPEPPPLTFESAQPAPAMEIVEDDDEDLAELERLEAAERPAAAPAADPAELRKQLHRVLHCYVGAADRWAERRQRGMTNDELYEAIGQEFGTGGASGPGDPGYNSKGGLFPRLWLGHWQDGKPALQGAALRVAVRELLEIPYPGFPPVAVEAPVVDDSPLTLNISFSPDATRKPLVSIYRGFSRLDHIPRDIAERAHAAIEELTEPEPTIVDDADVPEAAPDWLIHDTFTVNNGD